MRDSPFRIVAVAAMSLVCNAALAQNQTRNPACQQLEAQLAAIDRGNDDPTRADQIHRTEDAVNRQQFEVDRLVSQGRKIGCENSGFFSIFSSPPAQCGPLNRQIDQARSNLERMQNEREQLQGGTTERAAKRGSLLITLGDNGCGPQYRSAAIAGQQDGFFDRLFGNTPFSGQSEQSGTFRTICVRTCDGYFFPISFATTPSKFRDDDQTCQRMCPAAEVSLYTYHNPGEEVSQAVGLNGRLYSELPNAFHYRTKLDPACSCRKPGQSWADALKTVDDSTIEQGDIVVNEQRAKQLSQPRIGADGKPIKQDPRTAKTTPTTTTTAPATDETEPGKRKVRTVGPAFYPVR
jgi:hypothetical protein